MNKSSRMQKIVIEINTDYKSKMIRHRKVFMENLIKCMSGQDEAHQEGVNVLLTFGTRFLCEREAGDDMSVRINGELVYPVKND